MTVLDTDLASDHLAAEAARRLEQRLKQFGAPALAAAVVGPTGVIWSGAAGRRRADQAARVAPTDAWHLGSNTKAMTAATYARLVQADLARWDAPVGDLFPDIAADPAWAEVTIVDLLRHRSGLRDHGLVDRQWIESARRDRSSASAQRTIVAQSALSAPPSGAQGRFAYANGNYILAGAAIERILGQPWETAMAAWLFAPLGMHSAGFGAPRGDQPWGHASRLLGWRLGEPADPLREDADNPAFMGPAGTAHMSLGDHARFVRLFLNEGAGFLTRASISALTTSPTGGDRDYALGWGVLAHRRWARGPVLVHEGSNTLWHAVAIVGPARGLAVLTASNAAGPGARAAQGLAPDLVRLYAPGP